MSDDDALAGRSGASSEFDRDFDREDLCGEVENYIRARPFRALAIALLAGILVGKIIL
jgi:ElaB/YqjD/DUF883 family membrane-anchored ribosome-binding protein